MHIIQTQRNPGDSSNLASTKNHNPDSELILSHIWDVFQNQAVASSSFQTQSLPLLVLISKICPEMTVYFVDTGHHFPETLQYRDRLQQLLNLNVVTLTPNHENNMNGQQTISNLQAYNTGLCCNINKIRPLERALQDKTVWISGVRGYQTKTRSQLPMVQQLPNGLVKVHPLVHWTQQDEENFINQLDLPRHPLWRKGYKSIGCAPCTVPIDEYSKNYRQGRWPGMAKEECGMHCISELSA